MGNSASQSAIAQYTHEGIAPSPYSLKSTKFMDIHTNLASPAPLTEHYEDNWNNLRRRGNTQLDPRYKSVHRDAVIKSNPAAYDSGDTLSYASGYTGVGVHPHSAGNNSGAQSHAVRTGKVRTGQVLHNYSGYGTVSTYSTVGAHNSSNLVKNLI